MDSKQEVNIKYSRLRWHIHIGKETRRWREETAWRTNGNHEN